MVNIAIVDLQWFTSTVQDKRHIVKELAVSSLDRQCEQCFLFYPPTESCIQSDVDPKKAEWISNFFFQLSWTDGETPYSRLPEILNLINKNFRIIYVKGLQKKTFLRNLMKDIIIINIEDFGCPRLPLLQSKRTCLRKHENCALTNVDKITSWMHVHKIDRQDY